MKILLFGGAGQLGYELTKRAADLNFSLVSPVASEIDVGNSEQVRFITERVKPALIINAAAYTAVDKAETQEEDALRVNRDGARNAAVAAKAAGASFIHISTDYVFDGEKGSPISENDPVHPLNVYGSSKLAGEKAVLEAFGDGALIVRTSSLHGQRGENFVHTMLTLFEERDTVRVVSDQIMSPTWAGWLAETVLDLAKMHASGIIHASCAGAISWLEFAHKIYALAKPKQLSSWRAEIAPITAAELARPAKRPRFSAFDTSKLSAVLGRKPIPWEDGLRNHLRDLNRLRD